jgi:hypothetical protein
MTIESDLDYLTYMADEMKDYLLSDEVYWHTAGPMAEGTLGGILVRMRRLYAAYSQMSAEQKEAYDRAKTTIEGQLDKWRVQAENKARRELKARVGEWNRFIDELESDIEEYSAEWDNIVYLRTAIHLLMGIREDLISDEDAEAIAALDARYRTLAKPDAFAWDDAFAGEFPNEDFWWLYVSPAENEEAS